MATELVKIQSYISVALADKLNEYKNKHGLKSNSETISDILYNFFGCSGGISSDMLPQQSLEGRVEYLEDTILNLINRIELLAACRREVYMSRIEVLSRSHQMARQFKTVDYEAMLKQTVSIEECLPPSHLARFVVSVIAQLDLSGIYSAYGAKGGIAIAPEILLGLLVYGYATGVFSGRGIEQASYDSIAFRFMAGNLHPDHDTIAHFRSRFLGEIKELFVQVLELAVGAGVLQVADISVDGTKIHADASKSKAVSHKRLEEIQVQLRLEVEELLRLGQQADGVKACGTVDVAAEIARRQQQLERLGEAHQELERRAQERYEREQAEYEAKRAEREAYTQQSGRKPRGRVPAPPL